jgi:hypothetical protein
MAADRSEPREGIIAQRGFRAAGNGGYCFVRDCRDGREYWIQIHDCGEATFRQLAPGQRIAFQTFERRDGRLGVHRVQVIA